MSPAEAFFYGVAAGILGTGIAASIYFGRYIKKIRGWR